MENIDIKIKKEDKYNNIDVKINNKCSKSTKNTDENERIVFTKQMKKDYKILIPNMLPVHFKIISQIFINEGYDVEVLKNYDSDVVTQGLKYVHNDTCYPALLVIGQMISALNSGKYDVNKTALLITQTGGGCRASNYIHLLRKALKKAGYGYIPVISLNMAGLEKNPGFKVNFKMLRQGMAGLICGDVIMQCANRVRPYEINKGETDKIINTWADRLALQFKNGSGYKNKILTKNLKQIITDFSSVKIKKEEKIKVGIVGEIYVKYSPLANNNLEEFLASQNCEVCVPGVLGFLLYCFDPDVYNGRFFGFYGKKFLTRYFSKMEQKMIECYDFEENGWIKPPTPFSQIRKMCDGVIGFGCKMGEGWLLTAEMIELAHCGYENIICTQPFGCLPNHIAGKGMIRKIKEKCPQANIVAIDYDPGATRVNQENRIKLMLAVAKENLNNKENYQIEVINENNKSQNQKEEITSKI